MKRGEIWWADIPEPTASEPGYRRPVVIVQSDSFNDSSINTVIVITITSNMLLLSAPGNVLLPSKSTGLTKDSVANISQIVSLDKRFLTEQIGTLSDTIISRIDQGLKLVLSL